MSSRKLSDKEFDRYARNILKKSEGVAFDESAWAAVEGQLAQQNTSSSFISLKWLIPLIGVMALVIGYLTYIFWPVPTQEARVQNQNLASKENLSNPNFLEGENLEEMNPVVGVDSSETLSKNSYGEEIDSNLDKDELDGDSPTLKNNSPVSEETNESTNVTSKIAVASAQAINDASIPSISSSEDSKTQKQENEEVHNDSLVDSFLRGSTETQKAKIFAIRSLKPDIPLAEHPPNQLGFYVESESLTKRPGEGEVEKSGIPKPSSRWSVGLTLAPDFTTVRQLNEFTKPGLDIGLLVEYAISSRLSVTSGAILTRKLYNTTKLSEYEFPSGFWRNGLLPEEIRADCDVIDIPINLRYRLMEGERTSLFASAGVSSYLMLTEQYKYYYDANTSMEDWVRPSEFSNENQHFFGVYNLSVGITRRVLPKVSLEIEPYIKNSLGDVGWGQVQLRSTGVLFNLKYHFQTN